MRKVSTSIACLLLISLFASAQRGVDFRAWPDTVSYDQATIDRHINMMVQHNVEELWVDDGLDVVKWSERASRVGVKVHSSLRKFNRTWLRQCRANQQNGSECSDGLVNDALEPTPALIQLKKDYQPVQFSFSGKRLTIIKTSNRFHLKDLTYSWILTADGRSVESGEFEAEPDSTGKAVVKLGMKTATHDKQNYLLEVHAYTKLQPNAAAQGVEVAKEQFRLSTIRKKALRLSLDDKLDTKESKKGITLKGNNFKYLINAESGLITSLEFEGRELLSGSIQPVFYFPNEPEEHSPWNHDQLNWNLIDLKFQPSSPYLTTVIAELQLNGSSTVKMHYKIYGSGDCQITAEFDSEEKLPAVQRFGLMLESALEHDSLNWFGRGPQPSFHGSNSASFIRMNKIDRGEMHTLAEAGTDRVFSEIDWFSSHKGDEAIYFSSKSPVTVAIGGEESKVLAFYTDELSAEKLRPERNVTGQRQRFGLRIRPFIPEEESALKLSRYHAGSMQVPQPKTAVGVTNDAVE